MCIAKTSFSQTNSKAMNDSTNYSMEVIRYNIPEEKHQDFEKAYYEGGKYLKASDFCLGYQVIKGSEEPNNYIVLIRWTSTKEHLEGFRKSADFMPFFNLVKTFYNNIQEMKHYNLTSNSWSRWLGSKARLTIINEDESCAFAQ